MVGATELANHISLKGLKGINTAISRSRYKKAKEMPTNQLFLGVFNEIAGVKAIKRQ